MKYKVSTVMPYDHGQYYTNSYSIQNMLLRQIEFPFEYNSHDYVNDVYSDRLPHDAWNKSVKKLKLKGQSLEGWIHDSATPKQLLNFVREIFNKKEITGCRVVRFSNNGGYSLLRFDVYVKTNKAVKTYNDQEGPSIEWPPMKMDKAGMTMYF